MQLFYVSGIQDNICVLSEEESWHCMKVLRLETGHEIHLTDGVGNFHLGRLTKAHHKGCLVEIIETRPQPTQNWSLHIAMAPTKNIDRFEWFLEKATEIGIDEITPLICEHSERETVKLTRLEKVLVAAMKQSLKARLPKLNEPVKFRDLVVQEFDGPKFIAYCETGSESELHDCYKKGSSAMVLVGPEGDFSKSEVELAGREGYTPVSLGPSRLRTETAGVVVCATVGLMNRMGGRKT
jgi:16S rRNA (uracil1498-N3)-methyltransferase